MSNLLLGSSFAASCINSSHKATIGSTREADRSGAKHIIGSMPLARHGTALAAIGISLAVSTCIGQTSKVPLADIYATQTLKQEFTAFQPRYEQMRAKRIAETRYLAAKVFAREAKGEETACSHQILFELEHLLISSANFKLIDSRIEDLKNSLDNEAQQRNALRQDPRTGLWGACYDEWYLKLYASYDQLEKTASSSNRGGPLPRFLDRVNTPSKLQSYLDSLSSSKVRANGVDHGLQFDEMLSLLTRMLIFGEPRHYSVDLQLKAAMLQLICTGSEIRRPAGGESDTSEMAIRSSLTT